jgi:hypothetical protein
MTSMQFRQGDVFFESVQTLPSELEEAPLDRGAVVLAYGESSGHRHQIARGAKLFNRSATRSTERYIVVSDRRLASADVDGGGATVEVTSDLGEALEVQRHEPIYLPPGNYKVTIQREWTVDREVRRVQD